MFTTTSLMFNMQLVHLDDDTIAYFAYLSHLSFPPQSTGLNSPPFTGAIAVTANSIHKGNFLDALKFLTKIGQDSLRADLEAGVEVKYPGLKAQLEEEKLLKMEARACTSGANSRLHDEVQEGVMQSAVSIVRKDLAKCFAANQHSASFALGCDEAACGEEKKAAVAEESTAASGGFSFGFAFE